MTKDEVREILGPPDEAMGPMTITGPTEMIIKRDGKEEHFPLKPTTRVTRDSEWKYLRPTSESPEVIYTIRFVDEWVQRFWSDRVQPAAKP
jgi:hypothetical protein